MVPRNIERGADDQTDASETARPQCSQATAGRGQHRPDRGSPKERSEAAHDNGMIDYLRRSGDEPKPQQHSRPADRED